MLASGTALQAGLHPEARSPERFPPLFVRGVVLTTYVVDDPNNPDAEGGHTPTAVYCDVLSYSAPNGGQRVFIPRCLVSQDFGGIQSGVVYKPRATTMDVSGNPLNLFTCALGQLSGDHVLVSFLDGQFNSPIIVRGLPHPSADVGNAAAQGPVGTHLNLKRVDGSPWLHKHNGSSFGISKTGDFITNTCFANDGTLNRDGSEPRADKTGSGNIVERLSSRAVKVTELYDMTVPTDPDLAVQEMLSNTEKLIEFLKAPAFLVVKDQDGASLAVESSEESASLKLGSGDVHVAIAENLMALYQRLFTWLSTHTHPTTTGPSGPPVTPPPSWDPSVQSSKMSLPNG
jgi:hypothetical protein